MEKTKSTLTLSQALKLYYGTGIPKLTLQFSCIMAAIYLGAIAFLTLLLGLENGFAEAHEEISEKLISNMLFAMVGGVAAAVLSVLTYEKPLPGGKFFRTVKGGFATYKKLRAALELTTVIGICLYAGIISIINAVIPIMLHGTATLVSVAVFLVLGMGVANLINTMKNSLARSIVTVIMQFPLSLAGVFTAFDGKLGLVHIIALILAIVLIPVSHNVMLTSYRKHRWDN